MLLLSPLQIHFIHKNLVMQYLPKTIQFVQSFRDIFGEYCRQKEYPLKINIIQYQHRLGITTSDELEDFIECAIQYYKYGYQDCILPFE